MGSICTSVNKKDKEKKQVIEINRRDSQKTEHEKNSNTGNENEKDKTNKAKNTNRSEDSDIISGDDERSIKKKEAANEQKKISNPDIIISYLNNGKTEFQEVFKTNDNISSLFDILLMKKSKYAQYDLIANEELSLSSKLNEKIGYDFPKY